MKKRIVCLFAVCSLALLPVYASTSAKISKQDKSGKRTATLENKYVKAVFSSKGGRLTNLIFKPSNIDLTWNDDKPESGALKDQFAPRYFKFRDLNYELKLLKNTPEEASIRMTVKGEGGAWNFINISKIFTLKRGESRLLCKLEIANQPESMGEFEFAYWSHNFLGTKGESNFISIPTENGIVRFVPNAKTNNDFYRDTVRGWLAVSDKNGYGAVNIFDCRYIDAVYSWHCRESLPLDTVEWRFLPATLKAGKKFSTDFAVGLLKGIPNIDGAGFSGAGEISTPKIIYPEKKFAAQVSLEGFRPFNAEVVVSLKNPSTGKVVQSKSKKISLKTARTESFSVELDSGPSGTKILNASIRADGKELFDIEKIIQVGNKKTPVKLSSKEKKIRIAKDSEPWDMKLSEDIVTPHYKWAKPFSVGKLNALFLLPTKGARDVVELAQRMDLNINFPTIYPSFFGMSWRTATNPKRGANGLNALGKILENQNFDLIVLGGDVEAPWRKNNMQWKAFSEFVRNEILTKIKNGSGLVYINPTGLDEKMEGILASLKPLSLGPLDMKAAPFFEKADIKSCKYGKGRIVVINYNTPRKSALLTPHPGLRTGIPHSIRKYSYRFQEYQFAILAKVMLYAANKGNLLNGIVIDDNNVTLKLSKKSDKGKTVILDVFDKFSQPVWSAGKEFSGKKTTFKIPSLPGGKNFFHLKILDKDGKILDFGYASKDIKNVCAVKEIKIDKSPVETGKTINGKVAISGKLPENAEFEIEIKDAAGRKVFYQKGKNPEFAWNTKNALKRLHEISVKILSDGVLLDEARRKINVIGAVKILDHFPFMLWGGCQDWPEYVMPYVYKRLGEFGFNLIYTGGFADPQCVKDLELANTEVSSNWFGNCTYLHTRAGMDKWQKTHDKKYLIRPKCLNDPASQKDALNFLDSCMEKIAPFGSREIFQLGDEMSLTSYQSSWDVCFSPYCLKEFRTWLKKEYGSLDALNKEWETQFKSWDKVKPMTRVEIITRNSPAPWTDHREFMDKTFSDFLLMHKERIREKYPNALVGPTGVLNTPAVYGGNWNFWNMSKLDMLSSYGVPRLPLSFDRNKRLIMEYRGYSSPEAKTIYSLWEGLFSGERGANHWCAPIFVRPDLKLPKVRKYYSNLTWEMRGGLADLFYNSEKLTNDVAIHYSQPSLRANYLKSQKKNFYDNCLSYCEALEDLGIGYRFVSWKEIENGKLDKFKALILPESSALSEKEISEIKKFVKNGGLLIGDYEIGLLDKHCKKFKSGALDELFGIEQKKMGVKKQDKINIQGTDIGVDYVGSGVKALSGRPQEFVNIGSKKYPILIFNNYGKGKTVYFNFRPNYSGVRNIGKGDSFRKFMGKILGMKPDVKISRDNTNNPIMLSRYRNGKNIYIGVLPAPPPGNWEKMKLNQLREKSFPAKIELRENRHLYDVRKKKYLGFGKEFKTMLVPGEGSVLASLPYKAEKLELNCPETVKKGNALDVAVALKPKGKEKASHHVFLLEVLDPNGKNILHYRKIIETKNGKAKIKIPTALNDLSGKWQLTATDTATGINAKKIFNLE